MPNPPPQPHDPRALSTTAADASPSSSSSLAREPIATLLRRVRAELSADFRADRPIRVSRAPGRLDVMGGIADYTGSLVCEMPLDRSAAVALQGRDDRLVQVFSFNLFDEHKPFTLRIPLEAIASNSAEALRREFDAPGRKWAAYAVGSLFILHEQGIVRLADNPLAGMNLAIYSTVPIGAGVSSSAALEVATMMNVVEHFGVLREDASDAGSAAAMRSSLAPSRQVIDPMRLASLCQQVENRIAGAPCGIMDQVTSCYGRAGSLLRMVCQPHELQPPLKLPDGVRVVGINSNVRHSVGGGAYGRTRCAAFMAHAMILAKMREIGAAGGRTLERDPMNGYLANVDPDDYKKFFRPYLPEWMKGSEFLDKHGGTIDTATTVRRDVDYPVQHAADHHLLEARRVRNFVTYLQEASAASGHARKAALDRAGHLMYASHLSYTNDAMLGADECDLLVKLVRERESHGLYGAKITGGGSGGTVAVLCDVGQRADDALNEIMRAYESQTGRKPELLSGTSDGAWHEGTHVMTT